MMQDELHEAEMGKAVLVFLHKSKFLESAEEICKGWNCEVGLQPTFYPFVVDVNFMQLLDDDSELCAFVLKEPIRSRRLFREVIFTTICASNWLPNLESSLQILLKMNISSLPLDLAFQVSCVQDLLKCPFPKYYQLNGIIVAHTTPSAYTMGTSYLCPDSGCVGSIESRPKYLRVHVPGARERQTTRNDLKCGFCNSTLKENVKARLLSEKLVAEMVPIDSFSCTNSRTSHQSIPVYFRGKQIKEVRLGGGYFVIGVTAGILCLPSSYEEKIHLEADHGSPITFQPFEMKENPSDFFKKMKVRIGDKLHQLGLDDAKSSPYIISLVLSYYFGELVIAKGLFHKLKLGILLALAAYGPTVAKGNMSLLAVGSDTNVANRLLSYGSSLAQRMTTLTDQQQLKVSVSRDNESGCCFRMEANPLLLASGGVCYLGDINKFNLTAQRTLAKILEANSVKLETLRDNIFQASGFSLPLIECPLESQVWAYVSRPSKKQTSMARSFKVSGDTDVSKLLLDVFSIIFYTDSWSAYDNDNKDVFTMLSILDEAMVSDKREGLYSHEELQMLLKLIQRRNVVFEVEAEELINGYYVASRRVRNSAKNSTEIAITAVETLSSIAEAHARISFRQNVLREDAIAAIYLYEEYLTSRFGSSCFNVQPCPHLGQHGEREDFIMVLEQTAAFALNLHNFVSAYGKDFHSETVAEE